MLSDKDRKFFECAREVATFSKYKRIKIGAVAVYRGRVISTGFNSNKTHPLQMEYNHYRTFDTDVSQVLPAMHAETDCLHKIDMNIRWNKVELYVYRKCSSREHGLARPCPSCLNLIKDLGIKKIHYTTDDGYCLEILD